jgi:hypothetical protein
MGMSSILFAKEAHTVPTPVPARPTKPSEHEQFPFREGSTSLAGTCPCSAKEAVGKPRPGLRPAEWWSFLDTMQVSYLIMLL